MVNLWGNIVLVFCLVPEFTASKYCAPPKDYPNTKLRDQKVKTVYNPGSSVYYDCTPGYRRVIGSPFVRCRNGQWTPLNMKCERKSCGSAGEILNGYFDYMGEASFGDFVAAVCREGYHLKGNRYRLCQDSGWSGEIPSCEEGAEITCPSPSVANGVKVKGEALMYNRGNNVTFTCMDGFSLRGFREVTCASDSLWHPRLPECLPSSVGSGRITILPTINPVDEDVLQEDSPVGYCTAPNNYPGTVITDQHLLQRDFPPGTEVRYTCAPGYRKLRGGKVISLCANGMWTTIDLKCEPVKCPDPPEVVNGVRTGPQEGPFVYSTVIGYRCRHGKLIGNREIYCRQDGTWSGPPPQCQTSRQDPPEITCPKPSVANSVMAKGEVPVYKKGNSVTFTCTDGFSLSGSWKINCGPDGQWHPNLPECLASNDNHGSRTEEGNCRAPVSYPSIVIMDLLQRDFPSGTEVRYTCAPGYRKLRGSKVISLCANGMWTPINLKCETVKCADPPEVVNGVRSGPHEGPFIYSTVIGYRCLQGQLIGKSEIYCMQDGKWSGPPPECKDITCDYPYVEHGRRTGGYSRKYRYKDYVSFECQEGYHLSGLSTVTCGPAGQWTPSLPQCKAVTCPPPKVNFAEMGRIDTEHKYGESVIVTCMKGYKLNGKKRITCGSLGQWAPYLPQCQPITCRCPEIHSANMTVMEKVYKYGDSVSVTCKTSYTLRGPSSIQCGSKGQWIPNLPKCKYHYAKLFCLCLTFPLIKWKLSSC
ncbi:hypothetical protein JZ751_014799 [Albula glossodonta]|uniref:Sushi domain-containing protein n=1 Tax=Albula glossodonta TaxID=121402 RepID=A0A8T2MZR8_9TELE|nr:hypothetical protein JZ751_014799 [Albula glossodonta]